MNKSKGLRDEGKESKSRGPNKFIMLNLIDKKKEHENRNMVMSSLVDGSGSQANNKNANRSH